MITAEYTIPHMHITDREIEVPLDWSNPDSSRQITVFAREVVDPARKHEELPLLVFLQGGPGGKSPRPVGVDTWMAAALKQFRVVLLDQRGTGRSSRIEGRWLAMQGDVAAQADFLAHHRADSIVRDAEHLRKTVYGGRKWSTLGQSYGGFLTLTYLSHAPEAVVASYVTGGLASITPDASEVYRRTFGRVKAKHAQFIARYPHHQATIDRIADRLAAGDVKLPSGDILTVRRFQSLGIDLGMGPGAERLHYLLDEAFVGPGSPDGELSETFLALVESETSFATNPLFAALHESIYASGTPGAKPGESGAAGTASGATNWAAQRERDRLPEFAETARPLLFTGEMIFPWMFEETSVLKPFAAAVSLLAERENWSSLYDPERLAANEVPVAAAVYFDDMYVDAPLSLETAHAVANVKTWVTNEFEHDGVRQGPVFERLLGMLADTGAATAREAATPEGN